MKDENVEFYLFGEQPGNVGLGIRTLGKLVAHDKSGWICPFAGMVVYKVTAEQLVALYDHDDTTFTDITDTYDPFVTTAKAVREVGINIGEWEFGFLGDVTPKDDQKMLLLQTDSLHLVWLHFSVE